MKELQYKNLTLGKESAESVTEEAVNQGLNDLLAQSAQPVEKEGKAEKGDIVTIDFEGRIDGIPFEGGKGADYDLELGSGSFIPGFEDQLIGHGKGESVDVAVTFPEAYHAENLRGKAAVFGCVIHAVKEKRHPALDDEFAKRYGMETVDQLRAAVREHLEEQKKTEAANGYLEKVCTFLAEHCTVEIPPEESARRIQEMLRYYEQSIAQYGSTLESYLKMTGSDMEAFRQKLLPDAEKSLKIDRIYQYIAQEENIEIPEEEFRRELEALKKYYTLTEEQFLQFEKDHASDLKAELLRQKISDFLIANNQ